MAPSEKPGIRVTASDALEFEPVQTEAPKRRRWLRVLGWLTVIAGAGGAWAFYGPQLSNLWADAEAGVPVVRAPEGPVKVRPENPGGLKVPDRDKLVYDRLQGGAESRGPERLLPPPEQPMAKPGAAKKAAAKAMAAAAEAKPVAKKKPTEKTNPVATVPTVKDVAEATKPAPPPPPPAPVVKSTSPVLSAATSRAKSLQKPAGGPPAKSAAKPAPKAAHPPPPNPAPAAAVETARMAPAPAADKPQPIPSGRAYLVQLAAARSNQGARDEWKRLQAKHGDLLGGLTLKVTKADLGATKGIFYRLRAGPLKDEPSARALCRQLASRQVGCLIIKPER